MQLNIRAKLLMAFSVVLLLALFVGGAGVISLSQMNVQANLMYTNHTAAVRSAYEARLSVVEIGRALRAAIIYIDDPTEVATQVAEVREHEVLVEESLAQVDSLIYTEEGHTLVADARQKWRTYQNSFEREITLLQQADATAAKEVLQDVRTAVEETDISLQKLIDLKLDQAQQAAESNTATYYSTSTILIGLIVAATVIGFGIALFLSRAISRAVTLMVQAAEQIAHIDLAQLAHASESLASGDLTARVAIQTQPIVYRSGDEMERLALAFNLMITRLHETGQAFSEMTSNLSSLIGHVQESAEQVAQASEQLNVTTSQAGAATQQITESIQQLARGSVQQANTIAQTTQAVGQTTRAAEGIARGAQEQAMAMQKTITLVGEMNSFTGQVSQAVQSVNSAGSNALHTAQKGAQIAGQAGQGMGIIQTRGAQAVEWVKEMGNRSTEIGQIIETIDDIADKTDMLALNAAVEAARAGEHGRGFAVVADQVRKLSEDAKGATRDIRVLIQRVREAVQEVVRAMESMAAEVSNGSRLVIETEHSLRNITQSVAETTSAAAQITQAIEALQQKSQGVMAAVETVSVVVEESTAASEEVAASSREVSEAMESTAAIAEENGAATEEISASVEEMSAQVEEVVASAEELSALAESLRAAVLGFQVDAPEKLPTHPRANILPRPTNGHSQRGHLQPQHTGRNGTPKLPLLQH